MVKIQKKIKGYSVTKPGDRLVDAPQGAFTNDQDRRLVLDNVPAPPIASLRWAKRPVIEGGVDGRSYTVVSPNSRFNVLVNHYVNGSPMSPFECWVMGEPPRGLNAIAKSISMDLRSKDRGWVLKKLDALAKTDGEPFDMHLPDGTLARMPSAVAAFARLVKFRCAELGAFDDLTESSVRDALMSNKEPKTTTDGTLSWTVDVSNGITGDDFILVLKEAVLPSGQRRPFSLWLSGAYPKSLDGLCKCLSLDLRVVDIAWGARKLQQLQDCAEPRGEFMAPVPGSDKSAWYPSTVAYIAELCLHRLKMLGLLNEQGEPAVATGVVSFADEKARREQHETLEQKHQGILCNSCQSYSARMIDGCLTCVSCGASKCG